MSELEEFSSEIEEAPRPGFLTVISILSFIYIGLSLISGLINTVMGPSNEEQMLEMKVEMMRSINDLKDMGMASFAELMEKIQRMTEQINDNFYLASIITLVTFGLGLFGVIKMFKGYKVGFHIYIGYCLLSICALYIYISPANVPTAAIIFNAIVSGVFIFMYSRNLHWMKK